MRWCCSAVRACDVIYLEHSDWSTRLACVELLLLQTALFFGQEVVAGCSVVDRGHIVDILSPHDAMLPYSEHLASASGHNK